MVGADPPPPAAIENASRIGALFCENTRCRDPVVRDAWCVHFLLSPPYVTPLLYITNKARCKIIM